MAELLDWQARHDSAMANPRGYELPLVALRQAIEEYVLQAEQDIDEGQLGRPVWRDYVLGAEVGALLDAFVGLLNGPKGRLDGGTLDRWARDTAARIGYNMDTQSME